MALAVAQELDTEERNAIANDYIATFSTIAGRRVLSHMLVELGFFDEIESEEERVRHNYAKHLVGIMNALDGAAVDPLVERLINLSHMEGNDDRT